MNKTCKSCVYFNSEEKPLYKFEKNGYCEYWGQYVTDSKQCNEYYRADT